MLTRKALDNLLADIVSQAPSLGLNPSKIMLYGSYANGNPNRDSDVDIAIWDTKFTGMDLSDMEYVRPLLRKYPGLLDIHFFPADADANSDPFIEEIERTGKVIYSN